MARAMKSIFLAEDNGIVAGNRLWNSHELVPSFVRSFDQRVDEIDTEKCSTWNLFCWKFVWIFFSFFFFYLVFVISIVLLLDCKFLCESFVDKEITFI